MSNFSGVPNWLKSQPVFLGILLTVFAFFTFFWSYTNPPYLYWDENYHIASAQKYLNGTFFMEPHPPLAKMLIAAGEAIFDANEGMDDEFIGTDYAKELPGGFSFQGYRFFPVLLGWLIAPLLYLIFLMITRKSLWAFILSFLYVFDNALVTHSRAAMLDSIMIFFCVALIALYFLILHYKDRKNGFPLCSLLFGIIFGCAMATKALALIMVLLWPLLILHLRTDSPKLFALQIPKFNAQKISQFFVLTVAGFLITYVGIWHLHFSMGKTIVDSLPDNGYYQASDEYKALLDVGQVNTPLMLRENLSFLRHYSKGVPALNLCKSDENGSPFYFWPLGGRSINYRWETPDGSYYQYITLQANPAVWGAALLGLFLAFGLLVGSAVISGAKPLKYKNELLIWCGMWVSFMIAVSMIGRVMYLYHYFIPLIFSFIILSYVLLELKQLGALKLTESKKSWIVLLLGVLIFAGFQFYRPLTYYEPIDDASFKKRMILPVWDLRCVNCERESKFALPISGGK
ncbi:MAG: phospholipid carrier-dependent glycosyltransferase [Candidatus Peribacter sp.]|jgi:dolichyl-phosphate-mannose-protein mannosyltransferase|nr:phospholipid carrier-dependent glycosyltransferase [Candidatus Peribacter sp.]MBT4393027.1 phospholipid carrier-dependent glycosyltransferase [Candidatus Peribacter sp.]MBT4601087.1 phospholipid carrier-dependent glycosyltransferase [Candidatus Peribacter sp.]MBT5149551.1 phospholipid carrier-dependent glycosyltransferase [Candidatus Peribacter sp.]MBT5637425.1 phospholipid carrier-dependent glycosyltransferase [Candidatus Peribacter sp.]